MPPDIKIPNNTEIDKALREFEQSRSAGGQPPMPASIPTPPGSQMPDPSLQGIQFQEDKWKESVALASDEAPAMVRLLIKWSGGTITQKQAEYILLGFVLVAVGVSLYLFFGGGSNSPQGPLPATPGKIDTNMPI